MNKLQNRTVPVESLSRATPSPEMWGWLYIVIASLALIVLAFAAHAAPYFDFDLTISRAVQSIQAVWFDGVMRVIGWHGYPPQTDVWTVIIFLDIVLLCFAVVVSGIRFCCGWNRGVRTRGQAACGPPATACRFDSSVECKFGWRQI